jgi:hypothetical protein
MLKFLTIPLIFSTLSLKLFGDVKHALIESSLLLNYKELIQSENSYQNNGQRRLNLLEESSIQTEIEKLSPNVEPISNLTDSLTTTFKSFSSNDLHDSVLYAVNYLFDNHKSIGIHENGLFKAINSILVAFVNASIENGSDIYETLPTMVTDTYNQLIPIKVANHNYSVPSWSRSLSKVFIDVASVELLENMKTDLYEDIIDSIMLNVLSLMNDSTFTASNFFPSISSVDASRKVENIDMKFGGENRFMKFDPSKTAILQFTSRGLTEGIFEQTNNELDFNSIDNYSNLIGKSTTSTVLNFLNSIEGDNSLFAYESMNSISTGITLGAVYGVSQNETYLELNLPSLTAELISKAVSSAVINVSLNLQNGYELHRLAESVAFGSSMGAQLSTVIDNSLDYEENWELFSRSKLAEATSKGSANGSINAASNYIENDPYIPDSFGKTSRKEILQIASGSALGSLMGNTGLAIYYPTTSQIIKSASQGASMGGLTAQNLTLVYKPKGVTEEFEVEIARALAFGASEGALFQVVAVQNRSNPDSLDFESKTVETAESVSYGSAFGAVTGGIKSGEDPLIIKQAINQGVTEGSSVGISLALGYDATVANNVQTNSSFAINSAIQKTVNEAASNASDSMSVKRIQTSSRDMLLLMRKFNINPLFTNPTKIFSNPAKKEKEAPPPFKDEFPVASPI